MKKNSFVEGTMIATIAIVFTKILGMLYVIPFYATVGTQGGALYGYAYTIYNIFLDISSAGIPIAISKLVSEYNTQGMLDAKQRTFILGKKIISIVSVVAFLLLFTFAHQIANMFVGHLSGGNSIQDVTFVIRCVSFAILIIPYLSVAKGYLQGHNFIGPSSFSQVIEQIVRIAIIILGSYLALNIFNASLKTAVGIAVSGATLGGLVALIYIHAKMKNNSKMLHIEKQSEKDNVTNKEIGKKIISYAVPFIIINTAVSIYNLINNIFILQTMNYLGYEASLTEFINSAITTYGPKINMIVGAIAMGMSISLIPSIVESFTKKDWQDVNRKVNKALQIILVLAIPMTVGISLLATPIWSVFYGYNEIGSIILAMNIFTALFLNLYMITSSTLQSLNKFKTVYLSTLVGFGINAILSVPLMLLFNNLKLPPYLGSILATMIGYSLSIIIALIIIKKDHGMKYFSTLKVLLRTLVPTLFMIISIIILKNLIPVTYTEKISCIIYIGIISIVGGIVYIFTSYKMKLLNKIFGREYVKRIIKKLTFGKVSID